MFEISLEFWPIGPKKSRCIGRTLGKTRNEIRSKRFKDSLCKLIKLQFQKNKCHRRTKLTKNIFTNIDRRIWQKFSKLIERVITGKKYKRFF